MASIHREVLIDDTPENAWAAIRDFGEVHRRLAPGFVTDTRVENDVRIVTFANGTVVHELIVDIDDDASMQIFGDTESRSRFVWITDVTPDSLGSPIAEMVDQGIRVIKRTLDREASPTH
jgi:hypothetical protein